MTAREYPRFVPGAATDGQRAQAPKNYEERAGETSNRTRIKSSLFGDPFTER
jgi:hypothetical protein